MFSPGVSSETPGKRWKTTVDEFERSAPQEHQEFLEFLHIPAAEIETIRQQSRTGF